MLLCSIAHVTRSGYYKWLKTSNAVDPDHNDYLIIKEIFEQGKGKLGARKVVMKLERKGIIMNRKKVVRIMKKYGLVTKVRKINPYKMIMKKTKEHRIFPNILDRNFTQDIPDSVWCTDITYISFRHRFVYLSVVKDIASREAVAWHLSMHLGMDIIHKTIEKMKARVTLHMSSQKQILIHSDQGSHYTSPEYIQSINDLHMVQSMSRRGNCIDNSPMESFFGHMKDEIDFKACSTFEELTSVIDTYMHEYNNSREQWELKKMTPVEYRDHLLATVM